MKLVLESHITAADTNLDALTEEQRTMVQKGQVLVAKFVKIIENLINKLDDALKNVVVKLNSRKLSDENKAKAKKALNDLKNAKSRLASQKAQVKSVVSVKGDVDQAKLDAVKGSIQHIKGTEIPAAMAELRAALGKEAKEEK